MAASVSPDMAPAQVQARIQAYRASVADAKRLHKARQAARKDHWLRQAPQLTDEALEASSKPVWTVKVTDFGNGQREVCAWARKPDPERDLERAIDRNVDRMLKVPRGEGVREKSIAAATRRAKQKVRHRCKAMLANSLWSLTFRENVTDREVALKVLRDFGKRVHKILPGWKYVAVLEPQERGAWHIHMATRSLPKYLLDGGVPVKSWNVMRAIWRRAAGPLGGNFDESKAVRARYGKGRQKGQQEAMRCGAIASYIAGYVAKDFGDVGLNRKRYSCSDGIGGPQSVTIEQHWDAEVIEMIERAYAAIGKTITRRFFDPISKVFFVESDDSGGDTVPPK